MLNKLNRYRGSAPLVIAIFFFAFGVAFQKIDNISFYLLVLFFLIIVFLQSEKDRKFSLGICREYWPIILSMCGIVFAIGINQLSTGNFSIRIFDKPSRLALFVCVFWLFLTIPSNKFKQVKWGFILGSIICTIQIALLTSDHISRPMVNDIEIIALLSTFSFLSIGWNSANSKTALFFQITAGLAGLYSVYISQTRGVWMALPIFAVIILSTLCANIITKKIFFTFIFLATIFTGIFSTTNIVRDRIKQGSQDINQYLEKSNLDTSIGTRFQLWEGSWIIFKENPIFGIGREDKNFSSSLKKLAERKLVTPVLFLQPHSHNEFLYNMMSLGIFGLIGLSITYLTPLYYFLKYIRHPDNEIRVATAMGLALCLGFMIYGLVDVLFMYKGATIFYSISIAFFLAQIIKRKNLISHC
ncbi:O-antigen ligase family protein [Solimicrobium silvestre]|uniref:O-antigen ligase like membrane protein n=1 Tax=Solimicrobium silvestre TaxID=2099400 RepID=A0A2S9GZH2_9BURK|nr:O-antigen ligase family protein [Solimicrobium silvestre]PRC93016.1 O-antigen ligase like membrane protein [Solimicrobium silvestre]